MIKIDRSFVSQLNGKRGVALVQSFTDLGHAIDIEIVAEGVETEQEMSQLQSIGADHVEGYLLSRPLPATGLAEWVTSHERVSEQVRIAVAVDTK